MSKGIFSALCAAVLALAGAASAQDDVAAQETGAVETATSVSTPAPSSGRASISPGKLRILGGLHFGGGGDLRVDPEGGGGTAEFSLAPVVGLQAGVDYVMMDYFALGGELRATFFNTSDNADGEIGRSTFIDLDVKPRGRYVFDFPLEVYGMLPMGLTIAAINDDWGNVDGGAGFNLGFGGGANYFFTDKIGVNSEMAAIWHWFGAEYNTFAGSADAALRTAQFYLFLNFVYAL